MTIVETQSEADASHNALCPAEFPRWNVLGLTSFPVELRRSPDWSVRAAPSG